MKKIIAGVLLATCLAFGREATFRDMLDAIVYLGNGYLEVKNNQGRTIKLPSHLYGYKVMFEGLIDRDKSKQCISYKSLPQAQKARLALWRWSDTIEGHSTYPYQDDMQKQIEREAILLNDIATGTEEYKECQKVVIAKVGEMIDRLFSLFQSDSKPQAIATSYQSQATSTYDINHWIQKIAKARDIAKNTKEYKECHAMIEEFYKWETRRLYLGNIAYERDPLPYYEDAYRDIFDSDRIVLSLEEVEAQNKRLKVTSNDIYKRRGEIEEQIYKIQENLEKLFWQKLKAYEASKEYKVWRALEKQTLKYAYKNLESSSEWQTVLAALKQASLTKEYQEMTKAQNAVRATQAFKQTKKEAESRIYHYSRDDYGAYQAYRDGVRDSKEFKVWKAADKAYKATKEYKAAESLAQSQREKLRNEFRAIELVKKEIDEGRGDIAESIKRGFMVIPRPCGLATSMSMACLYGYDLIPKNWEDDLWYGKETTYDDLGRPEVYSFEGEYYWEY